MPRKSWDGYFMDVARVVATRSTCDRKHVGCVIVSQDWNILATGYNGSLRGHPHCDDVGHEMEHDHCVRTVHAEANAVTQAARHGVRLAGATAYVTASPCRKCFELLTSSGVNRIVCGEIYRDGRVVDWAGSAGVTLSCLA